MSNSISNLLIRNLRDVFGENNPKRHDFVQVLPRATCGAREQRTAFVRSRQGQTGGHR